jgi:hypothetical protein
VGEYRHKSIRRARRKRVIIHIPSITPRAPVQKAVWAETLSFKDRRLVLVHASHGLDFTELGARGNLDDSVMALDRSANVA